VPSKIELTWQEAHDKACKGQDLTKDLTRITLYSNNRFLMRDLETGQLYQRFDWHEEWQPIDEFPEECKVVYR